MSNVYENKGAMATTVVVAASDSLNKGALTMFVVQQPMI